MKLPVARPRTTREVVEYVTSTSGHLCVAGGKFSMGGQTLLQGERALQLDLTTCFNRLVWLKPEQRVARVQAGMTWRDLQDHLEPHDLVVRTMQSFSNFSIGGSAAVNAHGRYIEHGTVAQSIRALELVLADGQVVQASRTENPELFRAALGGYGLVGIITELEVELAPNVRLERVVEEVGIDEYDAFRRSLYADAANRMHNADLLAPHFDRPYGITWRLTDKPLTNHARLTARSKDYWQERSVIRFLTTVPGAAGLRRAVLNPVLFGKPAVKLLSAEASRDVHELSHRGNSAHPEGSRTQFGLQELFVPVHAFEAFAKALAPLLQQRYPKTFNVSLRHLPADPDSALPYAQQEVYCFAVFYKQDPNDDGQRVAQWVRSLLELALAHGGRFYLPYELHATREQFERAYPEVAQLRALKRLVDPHHRFMNELWKKYL